MYKAIGISIIALGIAGASFASAAPANAAIGIAFDIGNVAVGYTDGYMDNDHQYHRWEHRSDAEQYRAAHMDRYHAYRHDDQRHNKE